MFLAPFVDSSFFYWSVMPPLLHPTDTGYNYLSASSSHSVWWPNCWQNAVLITYSHLPLPPDFQTSLGHVFSFFIIESLHVSFSCVWLLKKISLNFLNGPQKRLWQVILIRFQEYQDSRDNFWKVDLKVLFCCLFLCCCKLFSWRR